MSVKLDTMMEVEKSVYIIVFTLGKLLIPDCICFVIDRQERFVFK